MKLVVVMINNKTVTLHGPSLPRNVEDWIVSSNKIGVLTTKTLVPELFKFLRIEEDAVYIDKYWAREICQRGGWYKREFVNWQILAFEFWEQGEEHLRIMVNDIEFELNTDKPRDREDKNVIQMIKIYKRMNKTKRGQCKYFECETLDGHSQLCCLCGDKDIKLLRRKQ